MDASERFMRAVISSAIKNKPAKHPQEMQTSLGTRSLAVSRKINDGEP
jgi:hypothetical protein